MMAAINAYNYLSCDGRSFFGELFSSPICPCLPRTFEFVNDVFSEIAELFPSQYIHIGGDEVDRSFWEKSAECKALMEKEGLKSSAELQSYFIRKMEALFKSKGKKLIGWDEILEGGVSKTATIMYWRTWVPKAPITAVKNGNKVIMAPGDPLYFNRQPGKNSIPEVYYFNPIPKGLTKIEAQSILGAQANLWTEVVPSERRADYMIMPRLTALAERLWSHPDNNYQSYLQRLKSHYERLDQLNVHYRLPDLPVVERYVFTDRTTLTIEKPLHNLTIRYSTDSTQPGIHSTPLSGPLVIDQPATIRLAAFRPDGSRGDVYDLQFAKQEFAVPVQPGKVKDGLICSWYKGSFESTLKIPVDNATGRARVPGIIVPKEAEAPVFALKYTGYINVPAEDIYNFYLTSDDGSVLRIANREVVNNDGLHSSKEKSGQVALKKGLHKMELDFVEGGGGYTLKLQYSRNGNEPTDIPVGWFKN
jgi:hexosaminidase